MATTAAIGYGTLLKRGDGGGTEVFTAIGELKSLSGPSYSMDTPEATHMASANAAKEYVAGLIDAGEVTAEVNFLNDSTQNLTAGIKLDWKNRTKRNFQIYFPTATTNTITFAAFVTGWSPKASVGDILTVEVKLKVTGLPTEA
jgi:hypothetical protein